MKKIIQTIAFSFIFMFASYTVAYAAPNIDSMTPKTGSIGTNVTLEGTNFRSTGNTVKFGTMTISNLPATFRYVTLPGEVDPYSIGTIKFTVPKVTMPQCFTAPCNLIVPVSVVNGEGSSNSMNFTVGSGDDTNVLKCPTGYIGIYPNCKAPITPSIKVLSPNGGEVYQPGQQIEVRWETTGIPNTDYIQINPSDFTNGIDFQANIVRTLNDGVEVFKLPTTDWNGTSLKYGKNFKINLSTVKGEGFPNYLDSSDNTFSIVNGTVIVCPTGYILSGTNCISNSDLTVTVTSPNNGFESIEQGSKVEIRWTSNAPSTYQAQVYVSDGLRNEGPTVKTENTGSLIYTLPNNLVPGSNYKAWVSLSVGNRPFDSSDKPFTVRAKSTTTEAPSITSLSPSSGAVGSIFVIKGKNFSGVSNKVMFGNTTFSLPATSVNTTNNNGNILSTEWSIPVTVPKMAATIYCIKAPCYSYYPVSVTTINGKSNEMNFTINDTVTNPVTSLSLISPQSGSTFAPGQNVNVSWNKGQNTGQYINIRIANVTTNDTGSFIKEIKVLNDGNETIHIPNNTPEGQYRIYVVYYGIENAGDSFSVVMNIKQSEYTSEECNATKFTRLLRYGSRNSEVDALQTILIDKGYLDENYATGLFSTRTRTALKALQRANALTGDGIPGPFTRALLNSLWKIECLSNQENGTN